MKPQPKNKPMKLNACLKGGDMQIGRFYKIIPTEKKCEHCKTEFEPTVRSFPFREKIGMFLGIEESGFLTFRLSGQRWASMNGGSYEEVKANLIFEQPTVV